MTNPVFYGVTATFPNTESAMGYVDWISAGVREVVNAGASSGKVVQLDSSDQGFRVETQYIFPDSKGLDRYTKSDLAARLKQEGMQKFGPVGVKFERRVGEILANFILV